MLEGVVGWTEARISEMNRLYAEGFSASQIATQIGGVIRNAVIGRLYRSGLRKSPVIAQHRKEKQAKPKSDANGAGEISKVRHAMIRAKAAAIVAAVEAVNPIVVPVPLPAGAPVGLLDLEQHRCRYPLTDRDPFLFCGEVKQFGSSYCSAHHDICWQKHERRQVNISEEERTRRRFQARRNFAERAA